MRKLSIRERILTLFLFNFIPWCLFFGIIYLTLFPGAEWQILTAFGFFVGWWWRGFVELLEYTFGSKKNDRKNRTNR